MRLGLDACSKYLGKMGMVSHSGASRVGSGVSGGVERGRYKIMVFKLEFGLVDVAVILAACLPFVPSQALLEYIDSQMVCHIRIQSRMYCHI